MIKYGEEVICMDDTHGTNMYDFTLNTILVVDEHGEGVHGPFLIGLIQH